MKHLMTALLLGLLLTACGNTTEAGKEQAVDTETTEATETKPEAKAVSQRAEGIAVGEQAPDFELKNVDGKTYSLAGIKDANGLAPKGYVVIFTCNTCPFAVASEQRIIDLHNKYAPDRKSVV